MEALDLITSLETSNESLGRLFASNVDLPPGAAHRSRTRRGYPRLSAEERLAETWRRPLARNKLPRVVTVGGERGTLLQVVSITAPWYLSGK